MTNKICTQCARSTNLELTTLYTNAVVLTRCQHCGKPLDPNLEYSTLIIVMNYALHRLETVRHVLFNLERDRTFWLRKVGGIIIVPLVYLRLGDGVGFSRAIIEVLLSHVVLCALVWGVLAALNTRVSVQLVVKACTLPLAINLPVLFIRLWEYTDVIATITNAFVLSLMGVGVFSVVEIKRRDGIVVLTFLSCFIGVAGRALFEHWLGREGCDRISVKSWCL